MRGTVMTFGSFDVLHPGHLTYLEKAKRLGKRLVVVVARDSSIRMLKGGTPLLGERERLRMVSSIRIVDRAVLGNRLSSARERFNIISKFRPDVLVFGYDQEVDTAEVKKWLKEHRLHARIARIRVAKTESYYKSSRLRKRLVEDE